MRITFVDTPDQANVTLDQNKLAVIVNAIIARYNSFTAFTNLYIMEDEHKGELHTAYYAPFANVPKVSNEFVYNGDTTGLIISIP